MKIKAETNNAINFGSRVLCSAELVRKRLFRKPKSMKIFISELDSFDRERMEAIAPNWKRTDYGNNIIRNFVEECKRTLPEIGKQKRYLVAETRGKKGNKKIKGLALVEVVKGNTYISYLQSENQKRWFSKINGIGSCLLFAAVKISKKLGAEELSLTAAPKAKNFYDRLGFEDVYGTKTYFTLYNSTFKEFLASVGKKLKIKNGK